MRGIVWRGTNERDVKRGSNRDDRLYGENGDDDLHGRSGDDWLWGDFGKDRLVGGSGNDTLFGQGHEDRLIGQRGNDTLHGGRANDLLSGGGGNDILHGGHGADRLFGGGGADYLRGDGERDVLSGGAGNDILIGGAGIDTLTGGEGRDRFVFETDDVEAFVFQDILSPIFTEEGGTPFDNVTSSGKWVFWNTAGGGGAGVDAGLPRTGDGSVHLIGSDGSVGEANGDYSAGVGFFWSPLEGPSLAMGDENSTLGRLARLSYDWYRDGDSENGENEAPALRLHIDADGNLSTDDTVLLIYEPARNDGGVALADLWQTQRLEGTTLQEVNFWAVEVGVGLDQTYDRTLADWINGEHSPGFSALSADSQIIGLDIGIGDGWVGSFAGAVDNIRIEFGDTPTYWNFEQPRPDLITDFDSGEDIIDLSMVLPDANIETIDQYLQVTSEGTNDNLVSIDLTGSGANFEPLVLLADASIDLQRDIIVGEEVIA